MNALDLKCAHEHRIPLSTKYIAKRLELRRTRERLTKQSKMDALGAIPDSPV
jgi:hypothetical protein